MKKNGTVWRWLRVAFFTVAWVGALYWAGPLRQLEWKAFDGLQRIDASQIPLCKDLSFIALDQRSLEAGAAEFGLNWPWPREAYAQVLEFLQHAGARLVLLDFIFTEPSSYGPEDDSQLAQAIQNQGKVFLDFVTKRQGAPGEAGRLLEIRPDLLLPLNIPLWRADAQFGVSLSQPVFLKAALGAGNVLFEMDEDGVARRIRPFSYLGNHLVPHTGFAPAVQGVADPTVSVQGRLLKIGQSIWPLDTQGNVLLRYPGTWNRYSESPKFRTSMIDIITSNQALKEGTKPSIDPELFRDRVVVVGSTAEGLMDLRSTPFSSQIPGFFIVAASWAAMAHQYFYSDHGRVWALWISWLILAGLGAWAGSKSFGRGAGWVILTAVIFMGLGLGLFFAVHRVIFLVSPLLGLAGAFGLSTGLSYRAEQQQKRFIQGAFAQVLSPSVLERLMKEPERLQTGGEQTELSIYFSDLAGFTKFSERLKPQELVQVLNRYLSDMVATIVDEQQGYVDKFIGDAVMAFWGAPVPDSDHAYHACMSALRNQEKLHALQPELAALGLDTQMHMRIGIHSGAAVVGMMGSTKKLNYTIMGDAVNLASRLEGVNKHYNTSMIISQETRAAVGSRLVTRELDLIRVKGKLEPTRIFELVARPGQLTGPEQDFLGEYQAALDLFWKQKFKLARKALAQSLRLKPDDFPAKMFMHRCDHYIKKAPGPKWDGVTVLTSK